MILINIKMQIRPEKMSEWLALADSYARDVNSEDGCLILPVRPESYRRQ
jgi:quinol monooxygenase YgiN